VISWLSLAAFAVPVASSTSTCAPPDVVGFWPGEGEVVPPDVVLYAAEQGACGGLLQYTIGTAGGEAELLERENLGGGLVGLRPPAALAPGTWQVSVPYYDFLRTFVVEADAPLPEAPAGVEVVVSAQPRCGQGTITIEAEVTFDEADGVRIVQLSWQTENGEQLATGALSEGGARVSDANTVAGEREACVGVRVSDVAGTLVDEVEACAEVDVCPDDDAGGGGEEDEGCGCATANPGAGLLVLLVPVALRRRRAR
jgi:MYXO-CTERM domain-containing protein